MVCKRIHIQTLFDMVTAGIYNNIATVWSDELNIIDDCNRIKSRHFRKSTFDRFFRQPSFLLDPVPKILPGPGNRYTILPVDGGNHSRYDPIIAIPFHLIKPVQSTIWRYQQQKVVCLELQTMLYSTYHMYNTALRLKQRLQTV